MSRRARLQRVFRGVGGEMRGGRGVGLRQRATPSRLRRERQVRQPDACAGWLEARPSSSFPTRAPWGVVWCGAMWCDVVWCDVTWLGVVR